MMGSNRLMVWRPLSVVVVLALLGAPGGIPRAFGAGPPPWLAAQIAQNEQIAEDDSAARLALLRLPPGAIETEGPPAGTRHWLAGPFYESDRERFLNSHAFWEVPRGRTWTLRWLRHHPPLGTRLEWESSVGHSTKLEFDWLRGLPEGVWASSVATAVVSRPTGGTALRADVSDQWLWPRGPGQTIPAGTRSLELEVDPHPGLVERDAHLRPRFASTHDRRLIDAVVERLEELPAPQFVGPSCGAPELDRSHLITLTLRSGSRGRALARISQQTPTGPCQSLVVRRPGRAPYALTEGWTVLTKLRELMHHARAR